jgi:hypothetical protein
VSDRVISIVFFVLIIAVTLAITAWASRRTLLATLDDID